ncbi:MAG: sigma-54-dependent Fis family transcriptional regulator [Gemmatimonadetes bacterium]|uniref:Sigma-54-dependent Fis family transcriptional regulator n=1 Tax=Candidatus Kutchimonas denitrificans TaxID=3056748 RepID=A0AAE4Z7S8_9BACT|nr:sigma-54-dependent Fis family transcriptional regulator [Gemmatimonadota bacterium]NIR74809.1 sigma-54-dependent Fis family transcriptional regulator [Candidatus Kutchimonas denitrificans]NIR99920.1 sigma-54-dependent Fis family transcriptional regulator [Gemmatimonadota bacterium]NIT65504.1 sigma-54-dependent Fis family transcriptional regulator [Gemmatimonadota bacterium]NIU52474.1 response regulator [Gemmatimonadota bacterium]
MTRILIIDDEGNIRRMLASLLQAEGFATTEAESGEEGLRKIEADEPDAVMLDLALPGQSGLEILEKVAARWPETPVVMMSGQATLGDAVKATRLGAFQFLEKPLTPEAVLITLGAALELRRQRDLNRALRRELEPGQQMVGRSAAIEEVRALVRRVAATDSRVLVTGESGTGKELVAVAIHGLSERRRGPFVRINCAAIPRDLIESELFGHEKGAFTGATAQRRGKFELANGGTLFLDEVGDLSPEAQAKLLRAIDAGEIERVGGDELIPVDVRIVAATNHDLEGEVKEGSFREDLFFRLHVMPIHIEPLRDRREDIPVLVAHFVERFRSRHGLKPPDLTDDAMRTLVAYDWPGNVRELGNAVERLMILYPEQPIGPAEVATVLPHQLGDAPLAASGGSLSEMLENYERRVIESAVEAAGGNVAEAARRLETDRPNLYRRMKRLGLR